jgi:hypothetical protein
VRPDKIYAEHWRTPGKRPVAEPPQPVDGRAAGAVGATRAICIVIPAQKQAAAVSPSHELVLVLPPALVKKPKIEAQCISYSTVAVAAAGSAAAAPPSGSGDILWHVRQWDVRAARRGKREYSAAWYEQPNTALYMLEDGTMNEVHIELLGGLVVHHGHSARLREISEQY